MPRYRLLAKHFINNSIYEEGAIVEYEGKPGSAMELVEDEAEAPAPKAKGKKGAAAQVSEEQGGE